MLELALARFPFPPPDEPPLNSVLDLLRYIEEEPAPNVPSDEGFSPEFAAFIEKWYTSPHKAIGNTCSLKKDPEERPTAQELLLEEFCAREEECDGDLTAWANQIVIPARQEYERAESVLE